MDDAFSVHHFISPFIRKVFQSISKVSYVCHVANELQKESDTIVRLVF